MIPTSKSPFGLLLLVAIAMLAVLPTLKAGPSGFDVTNEQLRGAMLTLVSSYNTLENNLERHEIRERALGEVIKKGLQTLHKGQRIFEPMRGTFSRLDDRISQMESLLIARDTELKDQQADTRTALRQTIEWQAARDARDLIDRKQRDDRFEQLLKAVNAAAAAAATPPATTPKPSANHSDDDDDDDEDVGKKVDDLAESVKRLRQEVAEMMADRTHADESVKALIGQAERLVGAHAASSEEVVAKLEQKLSSFYVTAEATASTTTAAPIVTAAEPQPRNNTDWENSVQSMLATIEDRLRSLQVNVAKQPLLDREFFDGLTNETLEAIIDMRIEVLAVTEKSFAKTASRIKESTSTLDEAIAEAVRTIGEQAKPAVPATATDTPVSSAAAAVEQLNEAVLHSYTELHAELASLRQLKKLALETSDNVLDVKRGMEYNVHAITAEIGELIRGQGAVIDASLSAQFSQLNGTIQANHNGALANLTAKIETEISQVWRQIGIMFQLVQSTEMSLNKLQEQTEIYVNGTSTVMDGMGGKVSQITDRMAEVDSNLNYLLGRLSLVTQEFNQIKTGLGSALDDIKSSFQSVQKKIKDVGPGPHNIAENETDYNVVNDQPAADTAPTA